MKKLLFILTLLVFLTPKIQAQTTRNSPATDGADKFVKLYPNPATSYITFEMQKNDKGLTVQVYSFIGRKMSEARISQQKTTLDLSDYNRGLYMYHLVDAYGRVIESGKFQVTK